MILGDLFPAEDYQFKIRFERGTAAEFFGPTPRGSDLISQRRHWLQEAPSLYACILPQGEPLLAETIEIAGLQLEPGADLRVGQKCCIELGGHWVADWLLLKSADGSVCLYAGCVCFSSSWSLEEKMGMPIEQIHGVVPGLNASIGGQIQTFLTKLRPGVAWLRANWGFSRSAELNQHPHRRLAPLDAEVNADEVWLRIERQALAALPRTGGVLFGIRLEVRSLSEIQKDADLSRRIARALQSLPEDMARYKNLASSRQRIVELLGQAG